MSLITSQGVSPRRLAASVTVTKVR
jgi:hypothetical protein